MKLASGTHSESNLLQRQKFCYKEIVTKTKVSVSSKFKFYTSFKTNNRSVCFNPIFFYKKHLKKLQHSQRGQFQIKKKNIKISHINFKITKKQKITQQRNNLWPYYPKEYAHRELTQRYSFTGLHINDKTTETNIQQKHQTPTTYSNHHLYFQKTYHTSLKNK